MNEYLLSCVLSLIQYRQCYSLSVEESCFNCHRATVWKYFGASKYVPYFLW